MHGSIDRLSAAESGVPGGVIAGVDLRDLPRGTELVVETRNSEYRLVLLDGHGSTAWIEGGRHFTEGTEVRIDGSTAGGHLLKAGWIGLGLRPDLTAHGKRLLTSPIRSIRIEPFTP
jgi:hypothetical protein